MRRAIDDLVPPPVAPEVITRDESRARATIRATRLTSPLRLDGKLDEEIYKTTFAVSDFVQQEPIAGAPATEKTDVWVFFDGDSVYIVGRCWDSHPEREIADEMRRDSSRIPGNENFAFTLDTFHDRRSGYNFELNPLGARMDMEISDDGQVTNRDWNPVWEVASGRFEQGWVVEARLPFKSIHYGPGTDQTWGFQVRRMVRWKNEIDFITNISPAIGERAHMKVSLSPTLVGLQVPPPTVHIDVKPYAISSLATDTTVQPRISNDLNGDWGADAKFAVSKSLTADVTYNTDFAQVEADLQQVNLTRFSLFFPEKRDFFLENSGLFSFGGATGADNTPALFYSRQIGLAGSQIVPIIAGGRLSGHVGRFSVGILNMETGSSASAGVADTNFSVVRIKRDLFRRSSVGVMFTNRSVAQSGHGSSQAAGIDGQFILTNTIVVNAFWAATKTPDGSANNASYRAQFDYAGDRYGMLVEHLGVGADFKPEVGFARRRDLNRSYVQARFSPRPRASKRVRKYYYNGTIEYIENGAGRVDTRTGTGEFAVDFQNSDRLNVKYFNTYEFLPARLTLGPTAIVPTGAYNYHSVLGGYNFGRSHKWGAVNLSLERGSFYSGTKTTANVTSGVIGLPPHVIVEPTYTFNQVSLATGGFINHLIGPRITYMQTPLMFLSALTQFNSTTHALSANVRFRWEYRPGSELFVVWNEQRDTLGLGLDPSLRNRSFVVKINRLFRF